MSHFYGRVQGSKGEATRCGHKKNGLRLVAAGRSSEIVVCLTYDKDTDKDIYTIFKGSTIIAEGEL